MNLLKTKLTAISAALLATNAAYANPFEKSTNKVNEMIEIFTGDIAKIIVTVCLLGIATAYIFNKVSKEWAQRIFLGCLLILSVQGIVEWIFST